MKITFIGVGRLGGALALALAKKDYAIENLVSPQIEKAGKIAAEINPKPEILTFPDAEKLAASDLIFITTQDSEIEMVSRQLAGSLSNKPFVFHASGSLSSSILDDLKKIGCPTGSLHPLVSVSDSFRGAERFADVYFCIEGDAEAAPVAAKIVNDLGGKSFSIETQFKALYHASAVMASGHLTALFSAAVKMLAVCGLSEGMAREILLPLVKSTVLNLETQTPALALTGTFARADVGTLRRHIKSLRENVSPEILMIYIHLGLRSAQLAERQGASPADLALINEILLTEINRQQLES